jgi:RNA polymerase sigma factor (sigma-70 family)
MFLLPVSSLKGWKLTLVVWRDRRTTPVRLRLASAKMTTQGTRMSRFWDHLPFLAVLSGTGPAGAATSQGDPIEQAVMDFQAGRDRERSFRQLVDAAYPQIRGFLGKKVFSADEVLELTQETFLSIYTGLDGFRRQASFRTWAFRIAHVTYLKWLQRRRSRPEAEQVANVEADFGFDDGRPVAVDGETPLLEVLRKEARQQLAAAIRELPEQEGRCVVLRVYHDLKQREIADFLGIRVGTVKAHLHHARQKLRARLAGRVEGVDF